MKNKGKIKVVIATLMVAMAFGAVVPTVNAGSQNVDTTWIVPGDTSISASFPTSEEEIEFNAGGQNFTDLAATSQTPSTAALRITNQGNQALQLDMSWDSNFPTGVTNVNISVGDSTNSSSFTYTNATATADQTVDASLADGGTEDFWFWTTGTEVAENGAGVTRSLTITSSAA